MASPSRGAPVGIPAKKLRKKRKYSSTPGSQKVSRCRSKPHERVTAKKGRIAKSDPKRYQAWKDSIDRKRTQS